MPVPYKGAAPAMTDLIAGHADLSFATLGSVLPHIKAGKIKALAVATPQRDPMLPDVPTFAESGICRTGGWIRPPGYASRRATARRRTTPFPAPGAGSSSTA